MQTSLKRILKIIILCCCVIALNIGVMVCLNFDIKQGLKFEFSLSADAKDYIQIYYGEDKNWKEEMSSVAYYDKRKEQQLVTLTVPKNTKFMRIDIGTQPGEVKIQNMKFKYLGQEKDVDIAILDNMTDTKDISNISIDNEIALIECVGTDPYIVADVSHLQLYNLFKVDQYIKIGIKVFGCIILNLILFIILKKRRAIKGLAAEVFSNKKLIWNLAKNDFKTRYAGSYLGIIWAFVQPIVTVLIYWFVFEVGFKSAPVKNFPYILWLIAGLVPWFFFAEALGNATNSMLEYSYLVKKVVFKISILPIVKIVSALFVHLFFIAFMVFVFICNGFVPNIYTIQILYYSVCMIMLVLAISYATSAIIVFFKDLGQVIGIILQVGMWMTPIMWSYQMLSPQTQWILKINPMYYVVEGYRDSLINQVWFWERFNQTIYFWIVVGGLFLIGTQIFRRLKVHFADVL